MIKLYNTLTKKIEEFKPIKKNKVGLYTCGPTVYNYAHIGNLRTYVFEDILKRVLRYNKYKIKHVMNITDVGHLTDDADAGEDKIEKGAKREGKTAFDIARFYTLAFENDLKVLNIIPPKIWCKATDHIKGQIKLIKKLEKKGFTYQTSDGVYFDTSKLEDYGKLSNLKNQKLKAGARVEMGEKKNPTDFALWKLSHPQVAHPEQAATTEGSLNQRQMEWKSPWGIGFPGWHIECSAMSEKYLGKTFDIHCGGIDHIPVHHTNEIAQSEGANGQIPANYWMHGEFLLVNNGKMAKSDDNFLTIQTLKDKNINPLAYRYFLLQTHYRKQLDFSFDALQASESGLNNLYNKAKELKNSTVVIPTEAEKSLKNKFLVFINNDLNIPNALALTWEAIKKKEINLKILLEFDEVLGLDIKNNLEERSLSAEKTGNFPEEIQKIIDRRAKARQNKDWDVSDKLRDELQKLGYKVEDTNNAQKITKL